MSADQLAQQLLEEFLKYDRHLPLEAEERDFEEEPDIGQAQLRHITFLSARDQRVPALLTLPSNTAPPYPVVLILHGVFGHKSSVNQRKRAAFLTKAGYATLRIDGQYCGERAVPGGTIGLHNQHVYRNRDAMIQTAIDLMRSIDYLISRNDIAKERIGFAGFSMGGAIGTLFCAHEPRIRAVVLGITGGDFSKFNISAGHDTQVSRAYGLVDPMLSVHRIAPRPLLMLNAEHDVVVPRAATEALFEAAGEPKRIIWYNCGHAELPDEALREMVRFFDLHLLKAKL
ncbi:MAG: hypothetical protein Kow0099_23360 [Candidatus Abyssubacteria bacterium]